MFTREKQEMKRVPMMPVRDMVIFPQQMTPFIVGREASVRAVEEALGSDKKVFFSTQHDGSVDDPKPEEIYAVGTLANIVQSVKLPDGNIKVLVEGVERARALSIATEEGFFRATIRLMGQRIEDSLAHQTDRGSKEAFFRGDGKRPGALHAFHQNFDVAIGQLHALHDIRERSNRVDLFRFRVIHRTVVLRGEENLFVAAERLFN